MTIQEYTQRTGLTPSEEGFNEIHAIYMNTTMDKDEFCKEVKKYGISEIARQVHATAVGYKLQLEKAREDSKNAVQLLIAKSCIYKDEDLRKMAITMVGEKEVIRIKMKLNLPLVQSERDFIFNNL